MGAGVVLIASLVNSLPLFIGGFVALFVFTGIGIWGVNVPVAWGFDIVPAVYWIGADGDPPGHRQAAGPSHQCLLIICVFFTHSMCNAVTMPERCVRPAVICFPRMSRSQRAR